MESICRMTREAAPLLVGTNVHRTKADSPLLGELIPDMDASSSVSTGRKASRVSKQQPSLV